MDDSVARVRASFDASVEREAARLHHDVAGRVSFEIHRRFLDQRLPPAARVLEVGAGPGIFTRHLARAGARINVTDLSPAQLEENRRRTTEAGLAAEVADWRTADIRDLSAWDDGAFDLTLAYGGPISYVFDDAATAVAELLRVTRPGGLVLASVMSTLGTYRHKIRGVVEVIEQHGDQVNDEVLRTGDLRLIPTATHVCRMFTATQIPPLVAQAGGRVTAMSASNWASLADPDTLAHLESAPERWERFLDNEAWICRQPGALDGGTHILFAAEHRDSHAG